MHANVYIFPYHFRFLSTGESFRSLAFHYRVGVQTVARIVEEVCPVIWNQMSGTHMQMAKTEEDWKLIAANFEAKWNFPHCVGAIDGKHIVLMCPQNSGSTYYNYKGTFSIVLLALVDANYKFTYIDIGSYGRSSDGGVFAHSNFGKALTGNKLHLPPDTLIEKAEELGPMPFVVVGDEAFPLQTNLMRPFPGRGCPSNQRVFNYRLSRARRLVEKCFWHFGSSVEGFSHKAECST